MSDLVMIMFILANYGAYLCVFCVWLFQRKVELE